MFKTHWAAGHTPSCLAGKPSGFPWTTAASSPAKTPEFSIPRKKPTQAERHFKTGTTPSPLRSSTQTHLQVSTTLNPETLSQPHSVTNPCAVPPSATLVGPPRSRLAILSHLPLTQEHKSLPSHNSRKGFFFHAPRSRSVPGLGAVPQNVPNSPRSCGQLSVGSGFPDALTCLDSNTALLTPSF